MFERRRFDVVQGEAG